MKVNIKYEVIYEHLDYIDFVIKQLNYAMTGYRIEEKEKP